MESQKTEKHGEGAEIYHGESLCKRKFLEFLDEIQLPKGIFPLDSLIEMGINWATGFLWLKRNESKEHRNRKIRSTSTYATEVTAFFEKRRMLKLTGVKSKTPFFWVNISDIHVDDKDLGMIKFLIQQGFPCLFLSQILSLRIRSKRRND